MALHIKISDIAINRYSTKPLWEHHDSHVLGPIRNDLLQFVFEHHKWDGNNMGHDHEKGMQPQPHIL